MSDVERLLQQVRHRLRTPPPSGLDHVDRVVADALRPGKLLRPELTIRSALAARSASAWNPDVERRLVAAALAMELLHVATLVHDDIIDASAERRGRPSVVATAGVAGALVIGDLLLARSVAAAGEADDTAPAVWARALECMAAGQLREVDLAAAPSVEAHAAYVSLKTGELFRASAEIGALVVGATPDVVRRHGAFGLHFGIAFQHLDDLLDAVGDPRRMGKPAGADAANGVPTTVSLLAGSGAIAQFPAVVAAQLHAARTVLPSPAVADGLTSWAGAALARTLGAALGRGEERPAGPVASVLDHLERQLAVP